MNLEELAEAVESLTERVERLENQLNGDVAIAKTTEGIRAFVERVDPSSHTERALAVGYYLEFVQGSEHVSVSDLVDGYRQCRIPPPTNPSDVLRRAGKNEWLLRVGTDGQTVLWQVTAVGQKLIESTIENNMEGTS